MEFERIGLCSVNAEFTRKFAQAYGSQAGIEFIVFSEIALEYVAKNASQIIGFDEASNLKKIILPTIEYIRQNYNHIEVIALDMEVLMHDEAVTELKKDFGIIMIDDDDLQGGTEIEKMMHAEYLARLEEICDGKTIKL
jgi:hypothetical protein